MADADDLLPAHNSAMDTLTWGSEMRTKLEAATARSQLPEPLHLFAYVFDVEADKPPPDDSLYSAISSSDPDIRPVRNWFGRTPFIRTMNLIQSMRQIEAIRSGKLELPISKLAFHQFQCNYQLVQLHPDTKLRYHPVLAHWVRAVLVCDHSDIHPDAEAASQLRAVVSYVKVILTELSRSYKDAATRIPAPSAFSERCIKDVQESPFDIKSYIRTLDDEGLPWRLWYHCQGVDELIGTGAIGHAYGIRFGRRDSCSTADPVTADSQTTQSAKQEAVPFDEPAPANASKTTESQPRPQQAGDDLTATGIVELSLKEPDEAQQALVSLPIDLASMELINDVLGSGRANLDNPVIACTYIQHGLRKLERLSSDGNSAFSESGEPYSPSLDPEEGKRKVRLLVLFIKNLIRRGLVPPASLQYDIQEICVRHAPIKEVRDLKNWFQTVEEA